MSEEQTEHISPAKLGEGVIRPVEPVPAPKRRGRPPGSKDTKVRRPVNTQLLSTDLQAQGKVPGKRDLLFLKEIQAFGFRTGWSLLNFFQELLLSIENEKKKNNGIIPIDKQINERVWQINDLFKLIMSYQFTRLKPLELNPNTGEKVVLNFNLSQGQQEKQQQPQQVQKVEEILDLLQTHEGGFSLPVPSEKLQ